MNMKKIQFGLFAHTKISITSAQPNEEDKAEYNNAEELKQM